MTHVSSCGAPHISFTSYWKWFIDLRFEGLFFIHFASINKFNANRRNTRKSVLFITSICIERKALEGLMSRRFLFYYQPQFCLSTLPCRHVGDKPSDLQHPGCDRILLNVLNLSWINTTRRSHHQLELIWDVRILFEPAWKKTFHAHRLFYESKENTPLKKRPSDSLWNYINETLEHNRRKTFFFSVVCVYWHGVIVVVVNTGDALGKCCGGPDVQITSVVKLFNFSFPKM